MTLYTDKAEYREQVIPEYRGNPLIEALPDIWSGGQVIQMLSEKAAYNNRERELDMQYRMHCIYRLFGIFSHWSSTLISNSGYPEASARAIYIEIH